MQKNFLTLPTKIYRLLRVSKIAWSSWFRIWQNKRSLQRSIKNIIVNFAENTSWMRHFRGKVIPSVTLIKFLHVPKLTWYLTAKIIVRNLTIKTLTKDGVEYICITDIARQKNPIEPKDVVENWLRSKNTLEYLGLWKQLNNHI